MIQRSDMRKLKEQEKQEEKSEGVIEPDKE